MNGSHPWSSVAPSSWTDVLPDEPHVDHFRNTDYGNTSLGPTADWGPALRSYTSMCFADARGVAIFWGPQWVSIFNEALLELIGGNLPFLGKCLPEMYPEVWPDLQQLFLQATTTGKSVQVTELQMMLMRQGRLEEVFFTGQYVPLRGDSGKYEGIYNQAVEVTAHVVDARRRDVVKRISIIPASHNLDEAFIGILDALQQNPNDIPMAMIYSFEDAESSGTHIVRLCGGVGVSDKMRCAPRMAELADESNQLLSFFRKVQATRTPLVLRESDGTLQETTDLFSEVQWSGHGEASHSIVIMPLYSGERLLGFYVQGTNPRRPHDQSIDSHIADMTGQIIVKWIACISTEEARQREEARKREAELQQRFTHSEMRQQMMATRAPMAMFAITPNRTLEWANDQYFEMTGRERGSNTPSELIEIFAPEHRERAAHDLEQLFGGQESLVSELPLVRTWTPPGSSEPSPIWILSTCFLIHDGDKTLVEIYATDISHQKWAESIQSGYASAALLAKQQQENFIDMTSHEMRNPLTAMMQLADGIASCLSDVDADHTTGSTYGTIVAENIEAANTILTCASHQKRIIDDVLILSRLESDMLSITPVSARPRCVVENTIRMFDGEAVMAQTRLESLEEPSYQEMDVDFVLFDTSRLTQVLINLISNAIKFTAKQSTRRIRVLYGAATTRPPHVPSIYGDVAWYKGEVARLSKTSLTRFDEEQSPLYLHFCIEDTGPGVAETEKNQLFKRFSQASKKTHITYGGSGLGLYICRELVERQGGEIGMSSRYGEGSIFAFYVETRHSKKPDHYVEPSSTTRPHHAMHKSPRPPRNLSSDRDTDRQDPLDPSLPASKSSGSPPSAAQEGLYHVLLVEDNLVNQKVLAKQLKKHHCTVSIANHGEEALQVLETTGHWNPSQEQRHQPIQVVLMDWEMPVMNGLTCCSRIRELERDRKVSRRLPIIAVTANVRQEQIDKALEAGMDNVLPKPFTAGELMRRIESTMQDNDAAMKK